MLDAPDRYRDWPCPIDGQTRTRTAPRAPGPLPTPERRSDGGPTALPAQATQTGRQPRAAQTGATQAQSVLVARRDQWLATADLPGRHVDATVPRDDL